MSSDKVEIGVGDAGWYVRDVGGGHGPQLWHVTDRTATRLGVSNPQDNPGSYYAAAPGETIWDSIRHNTGWLDGMDAPGPFKRMILAPGDFHRRVARPIALMDDGMLCVPDAGSEERYIRGAQNQLESLIDGLRAICRVVQPSPTTLAVFGHEIRNLLILASTEVEMHWRGVLTANGRPIRGNTKQYVTLAEPLRLRDYMVRFHPCPDIETFAPFAGWEAKESSKTLPWYAAYNGVKHNREFEFEKATLANAFSAVAACAVMLVAQFGQQALTPDISRFLEIDMPVCPVEQSYIMPQTDMGWTALSLPDFG